MAVNWVLYDNYKLRQHNGNAINFLADTIKIRFLKSTYTPNRASHVFAADLGANEVTGSNYTPGGIALASKALAVVANNLNFDCADITVAQHATGVPDTRIAVMLKDTGSDASSPVIAYADLGGDVGNVTGDLTLGTPSGIFNT